MPDEILSQGFDIANCGAVVCSHVASGQSPILFIQRDEPNDDTDSGFWFKCSGEPHESADETVMLVKDVAAMDMTVLPLLEREAGVAFSRESADSDWTEAAYGWSD